MEKCGSVLEAVCDVKAACLLLLSSGVYRTVDGALFAIILFSVISFILVPHPLAFCLSFSLRRGYDAEKSLFYYRSRNDKEVDFVTRQGTHVESLIQVCYDMTSDRTLKREVDSLVECAGELKCSQLLIVTMSEERIIEKNGLEIKVVPIHKF